MKWTNIGHEFDELGKIFSKNKKIWIYGAGARGRDMFLRLQFADCVEGFIDNNPEIKECFGKPVLGIKEFILKRPSSVVVVCLQGFFRQFAENQLRDIGYRDGIDLFEYYGFIRGYLSIYAMYSWDKVFIHGVSINPGLACNLRCKGCLSFVDKAKIFSFDNINDIKNSVDLYFSAVDYTYLVNLAGGETLLYPQLNELVEYIGKKYRDRVCILYITTNGTQIPGDDLCKLSNIYQVTFNIDDYSESVSQEVIRIKEIEEKLNKHHVEYSVNIVEKWMDLKVCEVDYRDLSETELQSRYISCQQEWLDLRDGKLSNCNYSVYAERALLIEKDDSEKFDLRNYTPEMKMQLLEYSKRFNDKGYMRLCKQCDGYWGINRNYIEVAKQVKDGEI